ncbi:MAG: UDP-N-acetylglucosamine 1-carboxyvinyltransferase [Alkaliphilus sp.]|nr:UDP-N-acetylglucosamine 1-carboxyvinyltransferase [bacterium AH-315-E09]PHS36465.1 MAG: UDP-N-acetylglucosamine 1-carboxyvinyltransferase [Alkaliphilus sp.]
MSKYIIVGGNKIEGELSIQGAKNAVLPLIAATVLNSSTNIIHDIPEITDVEIMIKILESLGCTVKRENKTLIVDSSRLHNYEIPEVYVREMRSSIVFLGAMLSRFGKIKVSYPGGCEIGSRPIDLHLRALKQMGAVIEEKHGFIVCETVNLRGCEIQLDFPSVGATENIMLAAVRSRGTTVIRNAAREPEVIELGNYINAMGGRVFGAGTATIFIHGVEKLHEIEYKIIPDRIVTGTYLIAAAITGGEILLKNVVPDHLQSVVSKLRETGCIIRSDKNSIELKTPRKLNSLESIKTLPYPGFPTDMQSQMMALTTICDGTSLFIENIFESRYKHVNELIRMGANIILDGRVALVKGVKKLTGASVTARDLRGGACLLLAGLAAEGETVLENAHHIERGYDNIHKDISKVGGNIVKIQ